MPGDHFGDGRDFAMREAGYSTRVGAIVPEKGSTIYEGVAVGARFVRKEPRVMSYTMSYTKKIEVRNWTRIQDCGR